MIERLEFYSAETCKPDKHEMVIVRGWGAKKEHYVWAFAEYVVGTAYRQWISRDVSADRRVLSFEPVEWARLPTPSGPWVG